MPRIQTFVSSRIREEIELLVSERRQEGATDTEATVSSITSMLIELGLRVYRMQREKRDNGFNQMEYNKMMLENMVRVRAMCKEIMRMSTLCPGVVDTGKYKLEVLDKAIANYSQQQMSIFFADDEGDY